MPKKILIVERATLPLISDEKAQEIARKLVNIFEPDQKYAFYELEIIYNPVSKKICIIELTSYDNIICVDDLEVKKSKGFYLEQEDLEVLLQAKIDYDGLEMLKSLFDSFIIGSSGIDIHDAVKFVCKENKESGRSVSTIIDYLFEEVYNTDELKQIMRMS